MIKTNPLSVEKIKLIASEIRKKFNVEDINYFPILEVLDMLMVEGSLTYQIIENDSKLLEDNVPALYNANDNYIYIKEYVIEEYENSNYRSSFTLAHELFHYLQSQVLGFNFIEVENCPSYEDPEWQANEFAGQLLIPEEYLNMDEEDLMKRYHVTMECVLTRKAKKTKRKNKSK